MCAGWFETRPISQNIIRADLPGRQPRSPSRPAPNLRGAPHLSSTALLLSRPADAFVALGSGRSEGLRPVLGWLCEEKITEAKIGRQRSKIIAFSTLAHIRIEAFFASVFRGGAALPPNSREVANRFSRAAASKYLFLDGL